MDPAFHVDSEEKRQALFKRAKSTAIWALTQYGLEWDQITYIGLSDNITYKIDTVSRGSYLLRIHGAHARIEEVQSELMLLQALKRGAGLVVPEGLKCADGNLVLKAVSVKEPYSALVTITRWVQGEHASGELSDARTYNMGAMMGALHIAAAAYETPAEFIRPVWGKASFRGEMDRLGCNYTGFLTEAGWRSYQAAAAKILSELETMEPASHNYGLIHGDLHSGNVVFEDDQPYPIDFGRCGYGYYLYDIAGSLLELGPGQRSLFIEGYERLRKLENGYARKLECFFIMVMLGNYSHHANNPAEVPGLREQQPYAQAFIREYLMSAPFLFQRIEAEKLIQQ